MVVEQFKDQGNARVPATFKENLDLIFYRYEDYAW